MFNADRGPDICSGYFAWGWAQSLRSLCIKFVIRSGGIRLVVFVDVRLIWRFSVGCFMFHSLRCKVYVFFLLL